MKFFYFTLIIFCSACALANINQEAKIRPGEVRWIEFPVKDVSAKLFCRNNEVKYVQNGETGYAFIVETYFSDRTPYKCRLEAGSKILHEISFTVEKRKYPAEKLKVDPKKIQLSSKNELRVIKEQEVLNRIYGSSVPKFMFTKPFEQPMNSAVTSIYGTKRVYNKKKKGQHLGIDYRAAIGDKVPASNGGKIVFAGDLFYTGWTVIIDHGVDIFTVYGHLSKTLVEAGQTIEKGEIIGLSGNTGRTSGPHLHWGVKIQGQYVDGMVLIEESKKYFRE